MSGQNRVPCGNSKPMFGVCSNAALMDRIITHLREVHPRKPADFVAAEIGISVNTVRKWFSGESTPSAPAVFALINAYGPEFIAAAVPDAPSWLRSAVRTEQLEALKAQADAIKRRMEQLR